MFVFMSIEKFVLFFKLVYHLLDNICRFLAGKLLSTLKHNALLVYRTNFRQPKFFSKFKVLSTTTGSNVDNARAFHTVNHIPSNNLMCKILLLQIWKTSFIFKPNKVASFKCLQDFDIFFEY